MAIFFVVHVLADAHKMCKETVIAGLVFTGRIDFSEPNHQCQSTENLCTRIDT